MDDRPAQVSNLEIPFLKVLERPLGFVRGMAGQMDLPVFADDKPRLVDQDGRIEPALPAILHDRLGIADLEADLQSDGFVEQRLRLRPRHVPFEEEIDIFLPFEEPPRKERRQGKFRKHDQIASVPLGVPHQVDQPAHHLGPAFIPADRPKLSRPHCHHSCHVACSSNLRCRAARATACSASLPAPCKIRAKRRSRSGSRQRWRHSSTIHPSARRSAPCQPTMRCRSPVKPLARRRQRGGCCGAHGRTQASRRCLPTDRGRETRRPRPH